MIKPSPYSLCSKFLLMSLLVFVSGALWAHEPDPSEKEIPLLLVGEKGDEKAEAILGHVFDLQEALPAQTSVAVRLKDAIGSLQVERELILERGANKVFLNLQPLKRGVYFLEIETDWETQSDMIVID